MSKHRKQRKRWTRLVVAGLATRREMPVQRPLNYRPPTQEVTRRGPLIHRLLRRFGNRCHWCGIVLVVTTDLKNPRVATVEHLVPRSRGGGGDLANLRPACGPCNWKRGRSDGLLVSLVLVSLLFGCAPLQRLDPVFPGPAPALDTDALTPPVEAASAPGRYAGDPVEVLVESQKAVGLAPSEYAYLLAVEAWALGWTDKSGARHPGLVDAYKLCATSRQDDRTYCEEQVRARALALQACRRELPKAFLAGTAVGAGVGAGATGALVGSACGD